MRPESATCNHSPQRVFAGSMATGTAVFLLFGLYWLLNVRGRFFPYTDDFALFVHSTRVFHAHPAEWFLRGFADYFRPYPDLAISYSEFLRPLDNCILYVASLGLAKHWDAYLLLTYLAAASVCAVIYAFARSVLCFSGPVTALVTLATAVSPALTDQVVFHPSFAFDYFAALWALLCLFFLVRGRLLAAWLFCLLAVFTKEPAYYASGAAALGVFLLLPGRRNVRKGMRAAAFLLPIAAIFTLRHFAFHRTSGVYVMNQVTPRTMLHNAVIGAARWPFSLPGVQELTTLSAHNIVSLLLTVLAWCLVAAFGLHLLKSRTAEPDPQGVPERMLLLFLLGSCVLPILFNLVERFGASSYPLFFLVLGALAARASLGVATRTAAVTALALAIAVGGLTLHRTLFGAVLDRQTQQWQLSRSLIDRLHADSHAVRFLLDDTSASYSSPDTVMAFAEAPGKLVPVLNRSASNCASAQSLAAVRQQGSLLFAGSLPKNCGEYYLVGTGKPPDVAGTSVRRDLPEALISYRSPKSVEPDIYAWQTVQVQLTPRGNDYSILAPDLQSHTFRVLAAEPPERSKETAR